MSLVTLPSDESQATAGVGAPRAEKALNVVTLADVVSRLRGNSDLCARRQKQLEAGIRTFARLLERPIDSIPALPQSLARLFASLSATTTGKSAKTLANVASLVKTAVAAAGVGRRVRFNGRP